MPSEVGWVLLFTKRPNRRHMPAIFLHLSIVVADLVANWFPRRWLEADRGSGFLVAWGWWRSKKVLGFGAWGRFFRWETAYILRGFCQRHAQNDLRQSSDLADSAYLSKQLKWMLGIRSMAVNNHLSTSRWPTKIPPTTM